MGVTQWVIAGIVGLFLLGVVVRVFRSPLKLLMQVTGNTLLGFGALFLVNVTGTMTGLTLGFNVVNALVIGILGVPGLGLLLLLQWIF